MAELVGPGCLDVFLGVLATILNSLSSQSERDLAAGSGCLFCAYYYDPEGGSHGEPCNN